MLHRNSVKVSRVTHPSNDIATLRRAGDVRLQQLGAWLADVFGDDDFSLAVASADASFRRYFRVSRRGETSIAMDAPPDKEDIEPYVRIAGMLVGVGVNAPRVLACDMAKGFVLSSDLGTRTYLAELAEPSRADELYRDAMAALVRMQSRMQEQARTLPPYDDALLRREMALFPEWFCGRHLGLELEDRHMKVIGAMFDVLVAEASKQPRVFVHRDYHSRNLMVGDGARYGANPGILDFQDAVYGPVTYDLVSLLKDCYICWPTERVRGWVAQFREMAASEGIGVGATLEEFERWFDFMGVQRHLKVLGIFARLFHRDGKPGYLKDLPLTLKYVREAVARYAELQPLRQLLDELVVPAFERVRPERAP
jgi:aminoglycoside/choline kinase family phosphotransferase